MKSNYKQLGHFIRQVDVRNIEGKKDNLLGVSVQKTFIPSISNTVGTDFTKYLLKKENLWKTYGHSLKAIGIIT